MSRAKRLLAAFGFGVACEIIQPHWWSHWHIDLMLFLAMVLGMFTDHEGEK